MKRILRVMLVFVVLLCAVAAFSITVSAEKSGSCGNGVKWVLSSDGTLTINGTGLMENYDYREVVPWDDFKSSIRKVVVENGVKSIGGSAFSGCSALTSVIIPDTVTSIGPRSFLDCSALKNVVLGNGVTNISDYAFFGCSALADIIIPDSVWHIGSYCFDKTVTIYFLGNQEKWYYITHRYDLIADSVLAGVEIVYEQLVRYDSNGVVVVTLYAPDGSYKDVPYSEIENEKATGWWFEYPVQTVYHPNGECKNVPKTQVEQEVANGWYAAPEVYIYHPNGNSFLVPIAEAARLKNEGWYLDEYVDMYSVYGQKMQVPVDFLDEGFLDTEICKGYYFYPVTMVANSEGKLEIAPTSDLQFWEKEGYYPKITLYGDSGTVGTISTITIDAVFLPDYRNCGWFVESELVTMHCVYEKQHYTIDVPYTLVSDYQSAGWRTYAPQHITESYKRTCVRCGGTGQGSRKSPPTGPDWSFLTQQLKKEYMESNSSSCSRCYGDGYITEYKSYYTY